MSFESIAALPVPEVCIPETTLYLWVPEHIRDRGLAVMEAWGFHDAHTPYYWYKINRDKPARPGTGHRTRTIHEVLLVGHREKSPKRWSAGYPSIIEHPRLAHSRKPDCFYKMISELTGGRMLEMFARERRSEDCGAWDLVGDQVAKGSPHDVGTP